MFSVVGQGNQKDGDVWFGVFRGNLQNGANERVLLSLLGVGGVWKCEIPNTLHIIMKTLHQA